MNFKNIKIQKKKLIKFIQYRIKMFKKPKKIYCKIYKVKNIKYQ